MPKLDDVSRPYENSLAKRERKAGEDKVAEQKRKEAQENYRTIVQEVFATPVGVEFGKELVKQLGVFTSEKCVNPTKMAEDNAARAVYLELIRPFLKPKQRTQLES